MSRLFPKFKIPRDKSHLEITKKSVENFIMASAWFNARPERARDGPKLTVRIELNWFYMMHIIECI